MQIPLLKILIIFKLYEDSLSLSDSENNDTLNNNFVGRKIYLQEHSKIEDTGLSSTSIVNVNDLNIENSTVFRPHSVSSHIELAASKTFLKKTPTSSVLGATSKSLSNHATLSSTIAKANVATETLSAQLNIESSSKAAFSISSSFIYKSKDKEKSSTFNEVQTSKRSSQGILLSSSQNLKTSAAERISSKQQKKSTISTSNTKVEDSSLITSAIIELRSSKILSPSVSQFSVKSTVPILTTRRRSLGVNSSYTNDLSTTIPKLSGSTILAQSSANTSYSLDTFTKLSLASSVVTSSFVSIFTSSVSPSNVSNSHSTASAFDKHSSSVNTKTSSISNFVNITVTSVHANYSMSTHLQNSSLISVIVSSSVRTAFSSNIRNITHSSTATKHSSISSSIVRNVSSSIVSSSSSCQPTIPLSILCASYIHPAASTFSFVNKTSSISHSDNRTMIPIKSSLPGIPSISSLFNYSTLIASTSTNFSHSTSPLSLNITSSSLTSAKLHSSPPVIASTQSFILTSVPQSSSQKGIAPTTSYRYRQSAAIINPPLPKCKAALLDISDAMTNLSTCVLMNMRPMQVCQQCLDERETLHNYHGAAFKGECGRELVAAYNERYQLIPKMYDHQVSIWDTLSCESKSFFFV